MSDAAVMPPPVPETPAKSKIIIETRVRAVASECLIYKISDEFIEALDVMVENAINRACGRCTANGRKTLKAQDV